MKHVLYGGLDGVPLRLISTEQQFRQALQDSVQAAVEQEQAATEEAAERAAREYRRLKTRVMAAAARDPSARRPRR